MREECDQSALDLVVGEDHLAKADPVECEPRPSKFLTYALAIGLTAPFYWIYIQSFLFIREQLHDDSIWRYHIAGSGLTIGLGFYLVSIAVPSLYLNLKPARVVRYLQPCIQETTNFWIKISERRQSIRRWDQKTPRLENTEGKA